MDLSSPSVINGIKDRYGLQLTKSLGQNFITDRTVLDKIVEGAGVGPKDLVIEIGPGIGVLTSELAECAACVKAVEIDKRLIPILADTLSEYDNIKVINQDILKTDVTSIIDESRRKGEFSGDVHIIGNLPYYITTPIIMKLLEDQVPADSITVMMQKEVADRIRSGPGSRTYGAISVVVQYYCQVEKVTDVSKQSFIPRPKVDSTVLNLKPRKEDKIEIKDENVFIRCIKAGFAQRRKTLLNSLAAAEGIDKERVKKILEASGIDPGRRAETLTVEEFGRIADNVANTRG